jgi:hypothetical protein
VDIMALLGKIDLTAVVASALTFVAGWAVVKVKLSKAVAVIGELADLLAEIKKASEDGKYSAEEIKSIAKEGEEVIASFKK